MGQGVNIFGDKEDTNLEMLLLWEMSIRVGVAMFKREEGVISK